MKKKNKMSLESEFWAGSEIENPFELIDAFFDFAQIDSYKEKLNEMMMYMHNKEIYKQAYPGQIFIIYKAFHSLIRAGYRLRGMNKKWIINAPSDSLPRPCLGMLSAEEFADPLIVFHTAFTKQTLDQYEFFICELVHLSLSPHIDSCGKDLMSPFIYLTKMLEAAQLIQKRGTEKIK